MHTRSAHKQKQKMTEFSAATRGETDWSVTQSHICVNPFLGMLEWGKEKRERRFNANTSRLKYQKPKKMYKEKKQNSMI